MTDGITISRDEVARLYEKLKIEAESGGYHINPDTGFTGELLNGLLVNEKRYGYRACPCRLASGLKNEDLDIICPCDYRDPDVSEYGACYCALYVSQAVLDGQKKVSSIPERRPPPVQRKNARVQAMPGIVSSLPLPVWRCKVCGYLCARYAPPEVCPICKVKKERFERFI